MKTFVRDPRCGGYTLIELIVYFAVYALLLGLALLCFYKCFDQYFALRRQSDDITRAVRAGEIWRQDVRTAVGAARLEPADQSLRLPHADGEIAYRFTDSTVYRQARPNAPWTVLLPRVQASSMQADARKQVQACRWEVELQTKKKNVRVRPVFTFLAAPIATAKP